MFLFANVFFWESSSLRVLRSRFVVAIVCSLFDACRSRSNGLSRGSRIDAWKKTCLLYWSTCSNDEDVHVGTYQQVQFASYWQLPPLRLTSIIIPSLLVVLTAGVIVAFQVERAVSIIPQIRCWEYVLHMYKVKDTDCRYGWIWIAVSLTWSFKFSLSFPVLLLGDSGGSATGSVKI